MKALMIMILALMPVTTALAQKQEPKKPAQELLDLINFKQTMKNASNATFGPYLNQLRQNGFPEAGVKEVSEAAGIYFDQVASDPELMKGMVALYEKEFTMDELKELVAFYKTPIGQKSLQKLPVLTLSGAKLGEKFAMKHQLGFTEQMTRIMQKYKSVPKAPKE